MNSKADVFAHFLSSRLLASGQIIPRYPGRGSLVFEREGLLLAETAVC